MHAGPFNSLLLHKLRAFPIPAEPDAIMVGMSTEAKSQRRAVSGVAVAKSSGFSVNLVDRAATSLAAASQLEPPHHGTAIEHFSMEADVVTCVPYSVVSRPAILMFNLSPS